MKIQIVRAVWSNGMVTRIAMPLFVDFETWWFGKGFDKSGVGATRAIAILVEHVSIYLE